jgi:hypothetical protein
MGRYLMTVGAVSADAFVSALSWIGQVSPTALCITLLSSGLGIVFAANKIADGIMASSEEKPA